MIDFVWMLANGSMIRFDGDEVVDVVSTEAEEIIELPSDGFCFVTVMWDE